MLNLKRFFEKFCFLFLFWFSLIAAKPAIVPNQQYSYSDEENTAQRPPVPYNYVQSVWNPNFGTAQRANNRVNMIDNSKRNQLMRDNPQVSYVQFPKANIPQPLAPANKDAGKRYFFENFNVTSRGWSVQL